MKKIGIGILGGTGVGAGELLRLLINHEFCNVVSVVSSSESEKKISEVHSNLKKFYDFKFDQELNIESLNQYQEKIIFSSLPHGIGAKVLKDLINKNIPNLKIIDLSGDFRIRNEDIHNKFYPETDYLKDLREKFIYGLAEKNREFIKTAKFIANPGCYATASILSILPLLNLEIVGDVVFDGKSGTSGAGKTLSQTLHHPFMNANLEAYKILDHRHEPEINEHLGNDENKKFSSFFVPHLIPISRGMIVTSYLNLKGKYSTDDLLNLFNEFYKDSFFIRVSKNSASIRNVVGSNFCDISVTARVLDERAQVVVVSAIDNLVKGMAGQAIQNMNLMCGLDETEGLKLSALGLI